MIKLYHAPEPPVARALAHPALDAATKAAAEDAAAKCDPVVLLAEIRAAQAALGERVDRRGTTAVARPPFTGEPRSVRGEPQDGVAGGRAAADPQAGVPASEADTEARIDARCGARGDARLARREPGLSAKAVLVRLRGWRRNASKTRSYGPFNGRSKRGAPARRARSSWAA